MEKMTKKEFVAEVFTAVEELLPNCEIEAKEIQKNNSVVLQGLIIKNGRCNISPTIYLDYYYDRYIEGSEIQILANQIIQKYEDYSLEEDFDISVYCDFDKAKKRLCYKLVNYEQNKELLYDVPHFKYLDLAIVFFYLLDGLDSEGLSTILVKNSHMKRWGVIKEYLYEIAEENTPILLGVECKALNEVIKATLIEQGCPEEEAEIIAEDARSPLHILTNQQRLYGATSILYKGYLKELADEWDEDIIIIPSSVHETLLAPANIIDSNDITSLIKQVNETEVDDTEVLSDIPYIYKREEDVIIAA